MTFDFSSIAAKGEEKKRLRETVEQLVAEAKGKLPAELIARTLMRAAINHELSFRGKGGGLWLGDAVRTLERLRDGKITDRDRLLPEIAERSLNSRNKFDSPE